MSRKRSFFVRGQKQQAESWIKEIGVFTGKQHRVDWDRFSSFGETQKFIKSLEREVRQIRKKNKGITYGELKKTTREFRTFIAKLENTMTAESYNGYKLSLKSLERSNTSGFIKELLSKSSNITDTEMLQILTDKKKSKVLRKYMSEFNIEAKLNESFQLKNAYNTEILDQYFSRLRGDKGIDKLNELVQQSKNPSRALDSLVRKITSLEFKEEWDSSQKSMGVPTDEIIEDRLARAIDFMEQYLINEKKQRPAPKGKVINIF